MNHLSLPPVRPEAILTHESDLDGFLSGCLLRNLAKHVHGQEPPLLAYHNHNWRQRPMSEKAAWVSDLAFEARLDRPGWLIVDHHATEVKPRNAVLVHDPLKSAALLVWELCVQAGLVMPGLERLVQLSNISDLFLVDDPDFPLASDYAALVKSYGFWNLHELVGGKVEGLLDHPLLEVMAVKRRVEDPIGLDWSRRNIEVITPTVGYVDTLVGNSNLIVHRLLNDPGNRYPVLLTLFRKGNGMMIASLRSRNREALSVAERLQGGGHPNASGATLPRSVQNIEDALAYLRKTLNPVEVPRGDGVAELFQSD